MNYLALVTSSEKHLLLSSSILVNIDFIWCSLLWLRGGAYLSLCLVKKNTLKHSQMLIIHFFEIMMIIKTENDV